MPPSVTSGLTETVRPAARGGHPPDEVTSRGGIMSAMLTKAADRLLGRLLPQGSAGACSRREYGGCPAYCVCAQYGWGCISRGGGYNNCLGNCPSPRPC